MRKSILTIALAALALASAACHANKAVTAAAGGQLIGAAALVHCADIVSKDPSQGPILTAALNKAQAQLDAGGGGLSALATIGGSLSPDAQKALALVGDLLQQKMTALMAAAQASISACRMGILSQAGNAPK